METTNINVKSLEIKVIKVGNAKMTKSVFNQIRHDYHIFNNENTFKGELLGYVLIYESSAKKIYLLWSHKGRLKKTYLYHPEHDDKYDYYSRFWEKSKRSDYNTKQIYDSFFYEITKNDNQLFIAV